MNKFVLEAMEVGLLATLATLATLLIADDDNDDDVEVLNKFCGSIESKNGFANAAPVAIFNHFYVFFFCFFISYLKYTNYIHTHIFIGLFFIHCDTIKFRS